MSRPLLAAAIRYADLGYFVFPLRPRAKAPYSGTNGLHEASDREPVVRLAFGRYALESNIGASPHPAGAFILDIDTKYGADPEIVAVELGLDLDALAVVWTGRAPERSEKLPNSLTGRRGAQVWFRGEATTGATSLDGVEFRARGGYGVLPPSIHPSGDRYQGDLPPVGELPPAPASVLGLREGRARTPAHADQPVLARQDEWAFALACAMRARGASAEAIVAALLAEQQAGRLPNTDPDWPWTKRDFERKAEAVCRTYRPRKGAT